MPRRSLNQPPLELRAFRRLLDGQLTEREWQKQVETALDLHGWWWIHIPSNVVVCNRCSARIYRGIRKGFPDILAIRPPRVLWIELKRERGHVDPEQRRVLDMLAACGESVIQARPRDRERLLALIAS